MKRAPLDSCKRQLDDEARARDSYRSLLEDFLELQKEFVSKKRELQTAQQKRETLLAEVKFLRRRYRYLLEIQSQQPELQNRCSTGKMTVKD